LYKRQQKGWLKHLDFIVLDLLCLCGSFVLADRLRNGDTPGLFTNKVYISTGIMLLVFDLLVIILINTMHDILRRSFFRGLKEIVKQNLIVFGCTTVYLFSVKDGEQLSRIVLWLTMLLHIALTVPIFHIWRRMIARRRTNVARRSVLLVADGNMVSGVVDRFRKDPLGEMSIVGIVVADRAESPEGGEGAPAAQAAALYSSLRPRGDRSFRRKWRQSASAAFACWNHVPGCSEAVSSSLPRHSRSFTMSCTMISIGEMRASSSARVSCGFTTSCTKNSPVETSANARPARSPAKHMDRRKLFAFSSSMFDSITVPGVMMRVIPRSTSPFASAGSSICSQMATL